MAHGVVERAAAHIPAPLKTPKLLENYYEHQESLSCQFHGNKLATISNGFEGSILWSLPLPAP